LHQGVTFIQAVVAKGGKVYIHCHGGVGRAPTMAAAYFVSQGYSPAQAVEVIRKARPFIELKPAQLEQLERLELIQKPSGSYPINPH
jgi:protein-tyrosine phosphatase